MKLRLATIVASLALLTGCPEAYDDMRRSRGEAGDPAMAAQVAEEDYACTNLRRWRDDLDMPAYLKDAEGQLSQKGKEYLKEHEGVLTVCRLPLEKDTGANRGVCTKCTQMLTDPKYVDQRASAKEVPESNPIQLTNEQTFREKVEYRLKDAKEDYIVDPAEQEKSFRDWLTSRKGFTPESEAGKAEAAKAIEAYVEREKSKSAWTKDPNVPRPILKYGLPPLAERLVRCPTCTQSVSSAESRCWNCNNAYIVTPRDERNAIAEPLELFCPNPKCKQAVDPSVNFCPNPTCQQPFHRAVDREGPCWRCGGTHVCPECGGSGKGNAPIFGNDDCYMCGGKSTGGTNGSCPECDSQGFATYEGVLPGSFNSNRRQKDDWRVRPSGKAAAGGATPTSTPPADNPTPPPADNNPPEKPEPPKGE